MRPALVVIVTGVISLVIAGIGASRETILARQLPWLASGGMAGIGLVAIGAVVAAVARRRMAIAREIDAITAAAQEARDIAELLP